MDKYVAIFIAGLSAGLALYRLYVELLIGRTASTKCDFCELKWIKESRHKGGR